MPIYTEWEFHKVNKNKSLGANFFTNYAASPNCKIKALVSISNPFDLDKNSQNLKNPFLLFYSRKNMFLTTYLCNNDLITKSLALF
jgi:predicted alpha/beta-fold hydrolase